MTSFGLDPWLTVLLLKMAMAAAVVVGCSLLAERSGPLLAAMIATLPISTGPVYVFLVMEHDPAFVGQSAGASLISNLSNSALIFGYVLMAQRFGTALSLGVGLLCWFSFAFLTRSLAPSFTSLLIATPVVFSALHLFVRPYLKARPKVPTRPPWYVIPMRAAFVALLAGTVTTVSGAVGPDWSGLMAAMPIVFSSLIVILQPRIGGPATAAVMSNGALGLIGFGFALATIHLAAEPLGNWPALGLALLVCVGWNIGLMAVARLTGKAA